MSAGDALRLAARHSYYRECIFRGVEPRGDGLRRVETVSGPETMPALTPAAEDEITQLLTQREH